MQSNSRASLIVPILMIGEGAGWLLTAKGYGPGINWVWTLGLGCLGILTFVVSGIDKFSFVAGPLLLLASTMSVLRQRGTLQLDTELPLLVISAGILLLVARQPEIPSPPWLEPLPPGRLECPDR